MKIDAGNSGMRRTSELSLFTVALREAEELDAVLEAGTETFELNLCECDVVMLLGVGLRELAESEAILALSVKTYR